jgi:hypothetical protein
MFLLTIVGPGSTSQLSSLNAGPAPGAAPSRDTLPPGGNKFSMRRGKYIVHVCSR